MRTSIISNLATLASAPAGLATCQRRSTSAWIAFLGGGYCEVHPSARDRGRRDGSRVAREQEGNLTIDLVGRAPPSARTIANVAVYTTDAKGKEGDDVRPFVKYGREWIPRASTPAAHPALLMRNKSGRARAAVHVPGTSLSACSNGTAISPPIVKQLCLPVAPIDSMCAQGTARSTQAKLR